MYAIIKYEANTFYYVYGSIDNVPLVTNRESKAKRFESKKLAKEFIARHEERDGIRLNPECCEIVKIKKVK